MKWLPSCHKMASDKLQNGAQNDMKWRPVDTKMTPNVVLASLNALYLNLSFCSLHFTCLSLSFISKYLAQHCCKFCSFSVDVVVNMRFTANGMCVKNKTHVAQTSRNKMSTTWNLYCCLVPQCEALRTCCSAFPITTKWFFDQDVKVAPGTTHKKNVQWVRFIANTRGCCCSFSVGTASKVWFSHAQYKKMTKDEHTLGFKSCYISMY